MTKSKMKVKRAISALLSLVLICTMAGAGMVAFAADAVSYIDENGDTQTVTDYTVVTSSDTTEDTTWESGWYVVNSDVTYAGRISVSGTVNMILVDGCTQTSNNQIIVKNSNNAVLNIYGQSEGTGTLTVTASGNRAGIGGDSGGTCGTVTINGGIINATGGSNGAGIGGGYAGNGGTITINGGTVTATGGQYGAGIGGGYRDQKGGAGGTITINGGTVTATGGSYGAGIGGGREGNGGTITINGGTINATGGQFGAGIGGGDVAAGATIIINGGTVTATGGQYGAGIGGGRRGAGGTVVITGGTVVATAGSDAEGIGKGDNVSNSGSFSTGESGHAVIYASSIGNTSEIDNWSGIISRNSTSGPATVYGNPVITTDEEIPEGKTAIIEDGKTVTVASGSTLTANGSLCVDWEGTLTGDAEENIYYVIKEEDDKGISFSENTVTVSEKNMVKLRVLL